MKIPSSPVRLRRARGTLTLLTLAAIVLLAHGAAADDAVSTATTGTAGAAAAPAPVYNIEIIVFRNANAQGNGENWNTESARNVAGDESASGSSQVGRFVASLPESAWQLTGLEARLRASGAYVPLAHVAWSQTPSAWGTRAGFGVDRLGVNVPGLGGTVFLERGQFLHLGMTLSYAPPNPPPGLGAGPGTTFRLNESRRVRFYERNYFDHPAFGVIALVTPAQGGRAPGR